MKKVSSILYKVFRVQKTKYNIRHTKYLLRPLAVFPDALTVFPDLIRDLRNRRRAHNKPKTFFIRHPNISYLLMFIALVVISFGALRLFQTTDTAAWYSDSWGYRKLLTIDNTRVSGSSDLTNFPILVSLTSDANLTANAQADGDDILFTDSAGTKLDHEIESYDSGTLTAWVNIPSLSHDTDTDIYMYYGNPGASSQQSATDVWDEDTSAVYHLTETSGQHLDSTANNNDTTSVTVTTQGSATGKINGATQFDGTNDVIITPDSVSLSPTSEITIEGWIRIPEDFNSSSNHNLGIIDKGDYQFYLDSSDGKAHWVLNDAAAHAFSSLDAGLGNTIYSLLIYNGDLIAGGTFTGVGSGGTACNGCNNIALWNGTSWSNLDAGLNSAVYALTLYNGELYAGGGFTNIGSGGTACTGCNYIARWNGSAWTNLDKGFGLFVTSLNVFNDELYASGYFSSIGSGGTACTGCNYIAKWTGSAWTNLDRGLNNPVNALATYNGELYASGNFTNVGAGGTACTGCNYIAKWTGSAWTNLDRGLNLDVYSLAVFNRELYASGTFTNVGAGGTACTGCNYIAKWTGSAWTNLDAGLNNTIWAVTVFNGELIAGGTFTDIGSDGTPCTGCNYIARWNGSGWSNLEKGTNDYIRALGVYKGDLAIGGSFTGPDPEGTTCSNCSRIALWGTNNSKSISSNTSSWTANNWYHYYGTYDGNSLRIFINGIQENSISTAISIQDSAIQFYLGGMHGNSISSYGGANVSGELYKGILDETRIHATARSSDWIATQFATQDDPGSFFTLASEEEKPASEELLLAHWKLDEGTGTTANDASGNTNTGTISGATWKDQSLCVSDKCLQFDGTNDTVTIANTIAGIKTVSFWTRPNTNTEYFIDLNGSAYIQSSSGTLSATGFTSPTIYVNGVQTTTINTNNWNHITVTTNTAISGSAIKLGQISSNYLQGFMDDIKLYNYVRTADQIKQDYNQDAVTLGTGNPLQGGPGSLSQGLVGYWTMEDNVSGDAQTITDKSGNDNNMTTSYGNNTSGMNCTMSGKFGYGCNFDGTDDRIRGTSVEEIPDHDSPQTISAWINLLSTTGTKSIFVTSGGNQLVVNSDTLRVTKWGGGNLITSANTLATNTWYHAAWTWDGTKNTLYLNAQQINSNTTLPNSGSPASITIGSYCTTPTGCGDFFNGSLDEVRIYNRALSADEVQTLYKTAPGPVVYYNFDEGSGTTTVNDRSSFGNTGTITGNVSENAWVPGKFGTALSLDGSDDYVIGTTNGIIPQAGTVSLWIKPAWSGNDNTVRTIYGWEDTDWDTNAVYLQKDDDNTLKFWVADSSATSYRTIYTDISSWTPGNWHYLTANWDSSLNLSLYIDGIRQTVTLYNEGTPSLPTQVASEFSIVGNDAAHTIDDFKIYNYARTQEQILEDMNAGHPAVGTPVGSSILHLSFDEGYGDTAHDKSPQGNHANLAGTSYICPQTGDTSCPTWDNNGVFGKALNFSTVGSQDDSIEVTNESDFDLTSSFTISTWVKRNATGTVNQGILAKNANYSNANGNFAMLLNNDRDGHLFCHFWVSGFTWVGMDSSDSHDIDDTNWHHLTCTFDFTTKTGTLYVDNQIADTTTWTTEVPTTNNNPLIIGYYSNYYLNFNGAIDELKIYPFALTADQVATDYNQGKQTVLGSTSTASDGSTPSNAASREYCLPGDTSSCSPPILELNLEENTGTTAYDTSTNGNNGTLTNGPTWQTSADCKKGKCLEFDGSDDYINIPDAAILDGMTALTLESWVKIDPLNTTGSIISKWGNASGEYSYIFGTFQPSTREIRLLLDSNGNWPPDYIVQSTDANMSTNTWYHVVATWNTTTDTTRMYMNNKELSTSVTSGSSPASVWTGSESVKIGAEGENGSGARINGLIDQVRIYNYTRTPSQIAWDYNKGAPIAHYRFDECQGTTAYNSALNANGQAIGNNGTINFGSLGNTSVGTCSSGTATEMWANGTTGKWGSSLDFDGNDDYVNIDHHANLGVSNISVGAWVKFHKLNSGRQEIIGKNDLSEGWSLNEDENDGKISLWIKEDSGTWHEVNYDSANLSLNTWYHLLGTFDGETSILYVNGIEQSRNESPDEDLGVSTNPLRIGALPASVSFPFDGQIDDVRIYNYALTPEQVKLVHNNGAINFN